MSFWVFQSRKRPTVFDLPHTTRKQLAAAHDQQHQDQSLPTPLSRSNSTPTSTKASSAAKRIQQNRWVKREIPQREAKHARETKDTDAENEEEEEKFVEETIDEESYEWTPVLYPCLSDLRVDINELDLPGGSNQPVLGILSGEYREDVTKLWLPCVKSKISSDADVGFGKSAVLYTFGHHFKFNSLVLVTESFYS